MNRYRLIPGIVVTLLLVGACATTPPDPSLLDNARTAITQAREAGAEEYSPLELRFALERVTAAERALEDERYDDVRRLADQAVVEAQLALARTRAAITRAELAEKERELDQIRTDLTDVFGEEALER